MKPGLIVLILLSLHSKLYAQDTAFRLVRNIHSTDLLVGIHWQGDARESAKDEKIYRYVELGLAKGNYSFGMCGGAGGGIYISEEMYFGRDENIFGTKLGAWMHYLLDAGLSLVYYTDFKRGNFKVRPELGVGLGRMRAVVGYNIPTFNNKAFAELSHHNMQVSIQVTFGVKKK